MAGLFAILSPAKTLDMEATLSANTGQSSRPRLGGRTRQLASQLEGYSPKKLASLMSLSPKLADLNVERWSSFGSRTNPRATAASCFRGDVYQGLEAWTMKAPALKWAQQRVRILSGLYGLLRPLDVIEPYRLEMGTQLKMDGGSDLYQFWGDQIAKLLRKDLAEAGATALVNLASDEYSKAARLDSLPVPVIGVKFLEVSQGKARFISFYGKKARGLMTRWMADHRPKKLSDLSGFNTEGYRFQKKDSSETTLVFSRPKPAPASAKAG